MSFEGTQQPPTPTEPAAPPAAVEPTAPVAPAEPPAAPDPFAPILQRFDAFEQQLQSLQQAVIPPEPASPPPAAPQPPAMRELLAELEDNHFNDDGSITVEGLLALNRLETQRLLEQQSASSAAERAEDRRVREMEALETRHATLLVNPDVVDAVADRVLGFAQRVASATGQDWRVLANTPAVIEEVLLAMYPQGEGGGGEPAPVPTPAVPLERPSAAAPTGGAPSGDDGDRLVALSQQGRFSVGKQ